MSSTEGMINGGSSTANSKAPAPAYDPEHTTEHTHASTEGNGGFISQNKMTVVPPKKEDLQRKYATVVEQEAGDNDWYGGMSKYHIYYSHETSNLQIQ